MHNLRRFAFRSFSVPLRLSSSPAFAPSQASNIMGQSKKQESSSVRDESATENKPLPALSQKDFQVYNRLAVQMDQFVSQPHPNHTQSHTDPNLALGTA